MADYGIISTMISVIMSVYNEAEYIRESVESILAQTVKDFEFIIIDDCSSDNTVEIIKSYRDDRIKLYVNETNNGLTKNLNKALKLCSGEYIARMDGDDICKPDRFAKQLNFFANHPDVDLISCRMQTFGTGERKYRTPVTNDDILDKMLINAVMPHPGFMMRGTLVYDDGFEYDENLVTAQDYDLESRIAKEHRLGMIPDYALFYRLHEGQVSQKKQQSQANVRSLVRRRLLEYILDSQTIQPTDEEMIQYNILADREYEKAIDWGTLEDLISRYYGQCKKDKRHMPKSIRQEYVLRLFKDKDWNKLFAIMNNGKVFAMNPLCYMCGCFAIIIGKAGKKIFKVYEA